ncbi:DNA polymerase delta subunit POL32 KNAG_0I00360 [Huiozyma naganishii CBS 8797]|uniref:DNA polymerase delta subunit 3 n=1 Tax=Huiozyma naganishii (strain ATCC MYA-139 / BCRC 22969 / CBS 8797 / KCTC 17520 / NBRC 10181 / NCYC 3082 / Yp74L-3) TaxID=1071383 RepID=J7S244_HUIN7|nr:hypothetical protein KNAG_0I00360 [Kazachstania naganishii CBS 8797]CCK71827.1 hypothetical protein KNAG_0I00360 [Kazachstania naganishii CBS 8797]
MDTAVIDFINDRLLTQVKPLVFTELIARFAVGPSAAKKLMYKYYTEVTTVKYNCIIVCCYSDNTIKVIRDLALVEADNGDDAQLTDCFIYALNPMDQFTPVNLALAPEAVSTAIVTPYTLVRGEPAPAKQDDTQGSTVPRAKTVEDHRDPVPETRAPQRSSTVPAAAEPALQKPKTMGLRSTELLAKMKRMREDKESVRQEELSKRRKEERESREKRVQSDPTRKAQIQQLNKLFTEDDDDDDVEEQQQEPLKKENTPVTINEAELEELLDTTADDSLLEVNAPKTQPQPQKQETYVDEDGYKVTTRAPQAPAKVSRPVKRSVAPPARAPVKRQTKQGSIESFFKRK